MYKTIVNPETGRKVKVDGKIGQKVLNKYKKQYGGGKYFITNYYKYYYDKEMMNLLPPHPLPRSTTPQSDTGRHGAAEEEERAARDELGAAVLKNKRAAADAADAADADAEAVLKNKSAEARHEHAAAAAAADVAAAELRQAYFNYNNKLNPIKKAKWFNESHNNADIDEPAHGQLVDEYFRCDNVTNLPAGECCDPYKKLRRKGKSTATSALCEVGIAPLGEKPLNQLSQFGTRMMQKLGAPIHTPYTAYRESKSEIKRLKREREKLSGEEETRLVREDARHSRHRPSDTVWSRAKAGADKKWDQQQNREIVEAARQQYRQDQGPGAPGHGFVHTAYGDSWNGGGGKKKSPRRKSKKRSKRNNRKR
jgi:hypothetical protein